jgi:hypothetical protein
MKEPLDLDERISLAEYRMSIANQRLKAAGVLFREGLFNDAISKAYFAIHAASRAVLILYDIRASTHEGVKTMLSKQLIRDAKVLPENFAKKYSILKALREDADYEDYIKYTGEDAEGAIDSAKEFVEKLSDVIAGVTKEIKKRPF